MTVSPPTAATPVPPAGVEDLPRVSAWRTYATVLRWHLLSLGPMMPLVVVVQAVLAMGVIVGFGFLVPGIDSEPATALFLSTGAPTVLMLTIGFVMVPQAVSTARTNGTYTYMRCLPIPRALLLATELTMWLLVAAPSVAVAELVAWMRFDLDLSLELPVLLGATLLVVLMASSLGYALAVTLRPMLAQVVTQVLVFFVMLFSPVTFPAERLPGWFQSLHDWLPVRPGADLVRAGLACHTYPFHTRDLLVLLVWTGAGMLVTLRALARRG